jgi:lipopolysaccharide assembly outer membrane protein LptD (OstA)
VSVAARCCLALALAALALPARVVEAAPGTELAGRYYTLETTVLRYNVETGAFASDAPIRITRPGLDAVADRAEGNTKTGAATLRGNVKVHDVGGRSSIQGKNATPGTLTCDQLDVDGKADTYRATGRVHYESEIRTASADAMLLDRKHRKLHLEGNVTLSEGQSTAHAAAVDMDLKSGEAITTGSPAVLTQPASPAPSPAPSSAPKASPRPSAAPVPRPATSPSTQ